MLSAHRVRAAIALLFALGALPAAAQYIDTHALFKSSLNGATVRICGLDGSYVQRGQQNGYSLSGWPSTGAGTLSIRANSIADGGGTCVDLTLDYTGTFTTDQQLAFFCRDWVTNDGNDRTTGAIPVFVVDPQLAVGDVVGTPTEEGGTATIPVRLRTRPAGNVTIAVTSTDTTEGTVSPSSLTFTQANWNASQTVTATGVNDALNDGDQSWNVRLDPASVDENNVVLDSDYNGLANLDVSITTVDQTGGPTQNAIAVTSTPANASGYRVGESILVRLTFNAAAAVTGVPLLELTVGTEARHARYASGSGSTSLTFSYPVVPGDADADGISVGASALSLNGGSIRLSGGTVNARLTLASTLTNAAAHKVDGSQGAPGIEAIVLNSPVGRAFERGDNIDVTLVFSEGLHVVGLPQVALNIGTATRQAVFAPSWAGRRVRCSATR